MEEDSRSSAEQEIATISMQRPHVVILGAGASRACCPNGDRNRRVLPLMADLAQAVGLDGTLRSWGIDPTANFEEIFSDLAERSETEKLKRVEEEVRQYFQLLDLPVTPTIYDHLILSLRETDLIATFNWDPLLLEAYRRNQSHLRLPPLAFLHGNVSAGSCENCHAAGLVSFPCPKCGNPFSPSPLLYPIREKDYASNPFIANEWKLFQWGLKSAFMITVFGYSAPSTDQEAIKAMKAAWGEVEKRRMEQTAFITLQTEDEVYASWSDFIHTHHYEITNDFYDSWIANHPRRTGEAYLNKYLHVRLTNPNPIPRHLGFADLWTWFEQFAPAEDEADSSSP